MIMESKNNSSGKISIKNISDINYANVVDIIFIGSSKVDEKGLNVGGVLSSLNESGVMMLLKNVLPSNFTDLNIKVIALSQNSKSTLNEKQVRGFLTPFEKHLLPLYNKKRKINFEIGTSIMSTKDGEVMAWSSILYQYVKNNFHIELTKLNQFNYRLGNEIAFVNTNKPIEVIKSLSVIQQEIDKINDVGAVKKIFAEAKEVGYNRLSQFSEIQTQTALIDSKLTPNQQIVKKTVHVNTKNEEVESIAKRHKPNVLNINTASC
jgi:hypothetical protein